MAYQESVELTKSYTAPISIDSQEFQDLLSEIAEDAKQRRQSGKHAYPYKAMQLIKESKLGAIRIPVESGGAGVSLRQLFDVIIQLAEADADVAHILRPHFIFVEDTLVRPFSDERANRLNRVLKGDIFGNAITEISSHAAGSKTYETTLSPDGDHFVLNGTKYFATGTLYADWVSVLATGPNNGVFNILIPTNREGVQIIDDWDGIGQKLTGSGTTRFHNVTVAKHEVTEIQRSALSYVPLRQLFLQAVIVGIVHEIVVDSANLVRTRSRSFTHATESQPKFDPQLLQIIGEISSTAFATKTLVLAAADAQDLVLQHLNDPANYEKFNHQAALQAAQTKIIVDQLALKAATSLFDVGGASATKQSAQLDRHWRNIRTLASHNPSVYKSKDIGNYIVNEVEIPINGYY